jgi:hypothetical protein
LGKKDPGMLSFNQVLPGALWAVELGTRGTISTTEDRSRTGNDRSNAEISVCVGLLSQIVALYPASIDEMRKCPRSHPKVALAPSSQEALGTPPLRSTFPVRTARGCKCTPPENDWRRLEGVLKTS